MSAQYEIYAVKRVRLDKADMEAVQGYKNEIDLLLRLRGNDRIIKLFDYEMDAKKLYMVCVY